MRIRIRNTGTHTHSTVYLILIYTGLQDTFPPCIYMNPTSHEVSALIHQLNSLTGRSVAAYTFDAGPNACLFLLDKVSLTVIIPRTFLPDYSLQILSNNFDLQKKTEPLLY